MTADPTRYVQSLSDELLSQADRVRYLIGNRHWLSDGTHKEHLLVDLLQRHLPTGRAAAKGFLFDPKDLRRCSTEQDIIIHDVSSEQPLFNAGGLAIMSETNALAAISVKSTISKKQMMSVVRGLTSARALRDSETLPLVWTAGIFFRMTRGFSQDPERLYSWLKELIPAVAKETGAPLQLVAPQVVVVLPDYYFVTRPGPTPHSIRVHGYKCPKIAAGLLVVSVLNAANPRGGVGALALQDIITDIGCPPLDIPNATIEP